MFKSAGLAKMFAGRRKFFRGPHVRLLWRRALNSLSNEYCQVDAKRHALRDAY